MGYISSVEERSWAARVGMQMGGVVVLLNGAPFSMGGEIFRETMQRRPLRLTVLPPQEGGPPRGLAPESAAFTEVPERIVGASYLTGLWAQKLETMHKEDQKAMAEYEATQDGHWPREPAQDADAWPPSAVGAPGSAGPRCPTAPAPQHGRSAPEGRRGP